MIMGTSTRLKQQTLRTKLLIQTLASKNLSVRVEGKLLLNLLVAKWVKKEALTPDQKAQCLSKIKKKRGQSKLNLLNSIAVFEYFEFKLFLLGEVQLKAKSL